tara:strand:+ start:101 stop:1636 length:1536 start_codon:yes stop_codon:yes gene_type:complete
MKLKTSNVIFSSALTGYLQKVIQFFVSIVTLPLIIASLGKVQYGILVLIGQTVGFLAMSDIGVSNSIGRFISKYTVQNNKGKIKEVIHTAFILLLIAAVIIIIITLSLFNWIPDWLNISKEYSDISKLLFVVNGFFLALMFPTRIGQGILSGKQMYPIINLMASLAAILQFVGVIILSKLKMLGLIELAFLMLGTNLLNQLIIVGFALRNTPAFTFKNMGFSRSMSNSLLNLGLSSFLISLSGILVSQGLIIAVGVLTNTITAGIYGVVMLVITNVSFLLTKMTQPMVTLASELTTGKEYKKLNELILLLMRLSLVISFLFSVSLFFYIEPLLKMLLSVSWDSQDYVNASRAIVIMSISITIGIPQFISRAVLQGVGLHWKASIGKVVASIISFVIGVSLMLFDFGVIGASIGWGLIWVLPGIVYFPRLISKFMKIKQSKIFTIVYLPGYFIGIVLAVVGFLLNQNRTEFSLLNILTGEIILTIITVILFLLYQKIFATNFNFKQLIFKSK